jgi:colanic acid/amylovoran biosynthesis glycosyltransferase
VRSFSSYRSRDALRVLHAAPKIWLELTQTWLYAQIEHLPDAIESHVCCERTSNLDLFPFPWVHSFEREPRLQRALDLAVRGLRLRRQLDFFYRCARFVRPAVVHSHFGPTGWEYLDVARAVDARHLVTFYGLDVNYLPRHGWIGKYEELFRRVDRVLCEGPHMRRCVVALGCPEEKAFVHRLGVDVAGIEFRPRLWNGREPLRVLMAASFREKKGIPYGILALASLRRSVDFTLTIVGGPGGSPSSRAEERRIHETIASSGQGDRVRLLGFQPPEALRRIARAHHVFLAPSVTASDGDTEGGAPVTLIDMAASGMAIVSSRHCDIPHVILDGETGLLAPERDPEALAACIERLVANPRGWEAMTAAGRRRMEELFDARKQGDLLAGHYRDLLEDGSLDGDDHGTARPQG